MLVESDQVKTLEDRIATLEKRLKSAEAQCQATTREIWQMENEVARWEERAKEAEERAQQIESRLQEQATVPPGDGAQGLDGERSQQLESEVARLEGELETLRSSWQVEQRRLHEESQNRELDLMQQVEDLQLEMASLRQVAHDSQEESQRAAQQEAQLQDQLALLQLELEGLRRDASLVQSANQISDREVELARELDEAREELTKLQQRSDEQVREWQSLADERREAIERLEAERAELNVQLSQLQDQLAELRSQAGRGSDSDLSRRLERSEMDLSLYREKNELLQEKLARFQERLELADEKSTLLQQKIQQSEERAQQAEEQVRQAHNREREIERELLATRERADRLEASNRDANRIFEKAEQQMREAEAKTQESWTRIRDAELRANQATVEAKKLADRLAEFEKRTQEADRETQRLAFQDPLTGLPNNNLINQYLDFTVKQAVRYRRVAALLVIDIDRFKVFNEAMGLKAGDELLIKIAERLKLAIRDTDSLGRRGEDEFMVLLSELNVPTENVTAEVRVRSIRQHVEVVANRLMDSFSKPFNLQGQKFYIQASIGIAICPDDGETPNTLYENADTAMYFAKENGRNRYQFFSKELRKQQEKRLSLDNQLRSGLERGEFVLNYLPIIQLNKGKGTMVGVEALVRWNHRLDGLVQPEYFLPAAEESGAIIQLGQWVLRQTCHQLREWLATGLKIFASVNMSKRQLMQADLIESVARELRDQGVQPEYLWFEVAEGFNTFNPDMMDKVIHDLGSLGIRIAIDDFGIGYSSLSRLNLAHTKIIKIDRSIVRGCPNDKQCSTICIAAINLANSLGLWSLAEGVENAAQLKFLTKYGCSLAQGFYFSEPLVASDIPSLNPAKKSWKI